MRAITDSKHAGDVGAVLAMAFLWPCFIPTTYYPSIAALSSTETLVAYPFYVVYPSMLLAAIALIFAVARFKPSPCHARKKLAAGCGAAGLLGHSLIIAPSLWTAIPPWLFTVGLVCAASYVAALTIVAGALLACGSARAVAMRAVASFALWELASLACDIAQVGTGAILLASPILATLALMFAQPRATRERNDVLFPEIPWHMIACSIALVFFDVLYIKILFAQSPDTSDLLHVFTSIVALLVAGALVVFIRTRPLTSNFFVIVFATLVILYIASLVIVLLIPDATNVVVKRFWAASGRCFKMFVFLVFCCLVSKRRLPPHTAFGLFVCLLVALPDYISFDLSCQSPILDLIVHTANAEPLAIVATFVTAALSIIFLLRETVKARASSSRSLKLQPSPCKIALEDRGLSEREMQVAEYIYRGYSAKRTAEALFLSESTVNSYTRTLYRKLDIHSKQDLIQLVDELRV